MTSVKSVISLVPFTILHVNARGYCYSCCGSWTILGNAGRLNKGETLLDIWNGEKLQFIKKVQIFFDILEYCNSIIKPLINIAYNSKNYR